MSCKWKVHAWKEVKIKIDTLNKASILEMETAVKVCVKQKLAKLDIILKNVNAYYSNSLLLINDRYGVLNDIEQIISAFGMSIKKINCNLKGKNYIVSDELFEVIKLLNCENVLKSLNKELPEEIIDIMSENSIENNSSSLASILQKIRRTGSYEITQKELIEETWMDGQLLSSHTIKKQSEEKNIINTLSEFSAQVQNLINSNNKHMQEGTTELLSSRAKQMGYMVKRENKGEDIQLVLVRME